MHGCFAPQCAGGRGSDGSLLALHESLLLYFLVVAYAKFTLQTRDYPRQKQACHHTRAYRG